jgi:hypothetical protein
VGSSHKNEFVYDQLCDSYICPQFKKIVFFNLRKKATANYRFSSTRVKAAG